VTYDYRYEPPHPNASKEERAATARRNVARSLLMDPLRVDMGPTASQLRARVLAEGATKNGRAPT
jgi:hypothetical protein